MSLKNLFHVRRDGIAAPCRVALAVCCVALSQSPLFADGVARSVEPVAGGCKVTLSWDFSGKVESDLIIEERLAQGWAVDASTVPFGSLDATWFSGTVAKFAVKPSLLASAGSISFTVLTGEGASSSGGVSGSWMMYLSGTLRKGAVSGQCELAAALSDKGEGSSGTSGASVAETAIAITSFKVSGGVGEFAYSGVAKAGTLVVEGCEELGKPWMEISRSAVSAGDGKVQLGTEVIVGSRFFRLKLLTEEE